VYVLVKRTQDSGKPKYIFLLKIDFKKSPPKYLPILEKFHLHILFLSNRPSIVIVGILKVENMVPMTIQISKRRKQREEVGQRNQSLVWYVHTCPWTF
jgi:hypothetical protein